MREHCIQQKSDAISFILIYNTYYGINIYIFVCIYVCVCVYIHTHTHTETSLVTQVKHLPIMWESLGREDPLEKEMATHSSIHAWKIPWTMEPGELRSMELQRVGHDLVTSPSLSYLHTYIHIPLVQCWIEKVIADSLLSSRGTDSIFCQEEDVSCGLFKDSIKMRKSLSQPWERPTQNSFQERNCVG